MCDGKSNRRPRHLLLILGLLWLISAARAREVASDKNENPIVIRGGLVFSEENPEGPIYVNQAHYLTTRTISLKHFSQAMQCTYDVLYTYDSHCKQTNKLFQTQSKDQKNKPQQPTPDVYQYDEETDKNDVRIFVKQKFKLTLTKLKYTVSQAPHVCQTLGAMLPEDPYPEVFQQIRDFASKHKVEKIYSGLTYDERGSLWRWKSNQKTYYPDTTQISYGGSYGNAEHFETMYGSNIQREAENFPVIYFQPNGKFHYRIASQSDLNTAERIMCMTLTDKIPPQPPKSVQTDYITMMTQLTQHACLRDANTLKDRTEGVHKEAESLLQMKFEIAPQAKILTNLLPKNLYDWSPTMSRNKREAHSLSHYHFDPRNLHHQLQENLRTMTHDPIRPSSMDMYINLMHLHTYWLKHRHEHKYYQFTEWLLRAANGALRDEVGPISAKHKEFTECDVETLTEDINDALQYISKYFSAIRRYLETSPTTEIDPWLKENYNTKELFNLAQITEQMLEYSHNASIWKTTEKCRKKRDTQKTADPGEKLLRIFKALGLRFSTDIHPPKPLESLTAEIIKTFTRQMRADSLTEQKDETTEEQPKIETTEEQPKNETENSEKERNKRGIQAAAAGIGPMLLAGAATNVIYSLSEGGAPLSWVGSSMGTIFGLATQSDLNTLAKTLQAENHRINNLEINQDEITKAIEQMNTTLLESKDLFLHSQGGTSLLTTQQDLKEMNRHLTVLVELTLLKFADIYQAAATGKVSPHVFNQKDLEQQAKEQLSKGISLTNRLDKVKMYLTTSKDEITVILSIPIEDPDQMYSFYKITPIPIHTTNQTAIPKADLKYVALAKRQPEYLVLDEDEFDRCVNDPDNCRVTSPIRSRNLDAHCVIQTYTTNSNKCPLVEWEDPHSTFIMYKGNTTIYSVGDETTLFVRCTDTHSQARIQDDTIKIKGTGTITLRAGCTASLPDGTKWHTPDIQTTHKINKDMELYGAHNTFPTDVTFTMKVAPKEQPPPPQIVLLKPTQEDLDTAHEFATAAFLDKNTLVPYLMRVLATLISLVAIVLLAFWAYRKCQQTLGPISWIPCIKAPNDNTSTYQDLQEKINTLQQQLKLQFTSFKNAISTRSLAADTLTEMTTNPQPKTHRHVHYASNLQNNDDLTDFV